MITYQSYEMHPCKLLDKDGEPVKNYFSPLGVDFVKCEEDDYDLICWSIYGRTEKGQLEHIADHFHKEAALSHMNALACGGRPTRVRMTRKE
jgi:hypothetical protein